MQLQDADLFRQQAYLDGAWTDADSGATFEVTNPSTGQVLGVAPNMGAAEADRAIAAADRALPAWRDRTAKDRASILRAWFDLMMTHQEDLARLMTAEQGQPLAESRTEIAYAGGFIEWFAEEGKRVYGDTVPAQGGGKRILVLNRDLRRTWKTLAGKAGVSKEIRDRLQNHTLQDVSSKSYDRWNYMPEKRAGMKK